MKRLFFLGLIVPLLFACSNDESAELKSYVSIATVENPTESTNYYLMLDDSTKLFVTDTYLKYYRPKDAQRVIAQYTLFAKKTPGSTYDYDVIVNDVYEILTKGIFNITPETEDSIGNDPVIINNIWVANNYLTVKFTYPGYSKMHFINLVADTSKTYTDNKIHLEFRHNDNNDYPGYNMNGIVSFNLESLQTIVSSSVDIVVHTLEYGSTNQEKTYNFTYKYGSSTMQNIKQQLTMPIRKAIVK